ncbi:hypothetical protein K227x_30510 [Rubripirellula lacrimiformis]|uniref:DUF2203 domain-containing protein n=1 Tax=Rubripirellula lacrimiformis TaxID=1930273 RepID=A0A517NBZ6_9BACT|nr:DUF2203 family protein [Rubripirellula lacrimiformis]QDT04657.1 hypothetical protein K227x_30510 [Rubripirellula lacrimiformis]
MVRAIHHSQDNSSGKLASAFTPSAATRTLPLVRRIMAELIDLDESIKAQQEQLRGVDDLVETIDHKPYLDELSDVRGSLEDDVRRMQSCIDELASFGVQVHQPFDGSVDFPALLNRRPVQLCWHPADDKVEHWHEVGQSSKDRQKLDAATVGMVGGY